MHSGSVQIINPSLARSMIALDLWDNNTRTQILDGHGTSSRTDLKYKRVIITLVGSVQAIEAIPYDICNVYKTAWELDRLQCIKLSADCGQFICHSQSIDIYLTSTTAAHLVCIVNVCLAQC